MKTHRMFYIGLGCLLSTLCWTITSFVATANDPYEKEMKELVLERLTCREISIVDENGEEAMAIFEAPDKGYILYIRDIRTSEGVESNKTHLTLYANGLGLYNSKNDLVAGIKNHREAGLLWAKNAKGEQTWGVDGNARKPIPDTLPRKD